MIRKTAAIAALGLFATLTPLAAQSGIGLVGGVVSSSISVDPVQNGLTVKSRLGFAGGLSLGMGPANGVGLTIEGLYAMKGADFSEGSVTGSQKVNYVEIPAMIRIGLGSGSTRFFLLGGGEFSYLLSCSSSNGTVSTDCKDDAKSSDYGVIFGAGVSMNALSISVRYDLGLANLNNDPTDTSKLKNKAIMALVSYSLGGGKK